MRGGDVNASGKCVVGTERFDMSKSSLRGLMTFVLLDDLGPWSLDSRGWTVPESFRALGRSSEVCGGLTDILFSPLRPKRAGI